jgi:transcriptional regulator with XRE-family HTH domain
MISKNMAKHMRIRKLTINQMAAATHIPTSTLKTYLRGRSVPPPEKLTKVANALRILPKDLTGAT